MAIFYQNGIQNTLEDAEKGAKLLSDLTGQPVGVINNKTAGPGLVGKVKDLWEYAPNGYTTKDVLTAYHLEQISKNGEKNAVVMFSAGNEDAYKAMGVLKLENRSLNNNVDFISVGSPRSLNNLQERAESVGASAPLQFNDWKDPVTHSKAWVAGTSALLVGSAVYGGAVGIGEMGSASSGLDAFFNAVIGGGTGKVMLRSYHTFEGYVQRNQGGVSRVIKDIAPQYQSKK